MACGLSKRLAAKTTFYAAALVQRSPPTEKSVPTAAWCCTPMLSPILEQAREKCTHKSAKRAGPWDGPVLLLFLLDKGAAKLQARQGLYAI